MNAPTLCNIAHPISIILGGWVLLLQGACSDTGGRFGGDAGGSVAQTECAEVAWGSGFTKGQPIANWDLRGFVDADGDHLVEQDEVEFTLEDIHCSGKESLVLVMGEIG